MQLVFLAGAYFAALVDRVVCSEVVAVEHRDSIAEAAGTALDLVLTGIEDLDLIDKEASVTAAMSGEIGTGVSTENQAQPVEIAESIVGDEIFDFDASGHDCSPVLGSRGC